MAIEKVLFTVLAIAAFTMFLGFGSDAGDDVSTVSADFRTAVVKIEKFGGGVW